jgi:type I restriction enzyme R subunit
VTEQGSKVDKGLYVDKRHKQTRAVRWEQLDDELLTFSAKEIDRSVVVPDQIRTVLQAYKTGVGNRSVPWPHTGFENVDLLQRRLARRRRCSSGPGSVRVAANDFAKEDYIQRSAPGDRPPANTEALIQEFRTSPQMRIAVTVDMIATGPT